MTDRSPSAPTPLRDFLALYRQGEYWESHEVLEGPWREQGSDFLQALILYASAWVHWKKGNAHGVVAQLRKTLEKLEGYPPEYLGIDVKMIRAHCRQVPGIVRTRDDWAERIAPLELEFDTEHVRGDEPELGRG